MESLQYFQFISIPGNACPPVSINIKQPNALCTVYGAAPPEWDRVSKHPPGNPSPPIHLCTSYQIYPSLSTNEAVHLVSAYMESSKQVYYPSSVQKRKKPSNSTSRFRGVSWHKRDRRWLARAWIGGKMENVGSFKTEMEAALAVETRYIQIYGMDGATDLKKLLPSHFPDGTSTKPTSLSEAILQLKLAAIFIHSVAHKSGNSTPKRTKLRK